MFTNSLNFIPNYLLPVLALWTVFWKGWALWKAVRRKDKPWFVALLIVNSIGILPLFYLFFTRKTDETERNLKKSLLQLGLSITVIVMIAFAVSIFSIGYGVKYACTKAQETYQGDCVLALMQYAENPAHTKSTRLSAVWALGQFGEGRALPVLQNLMASDFCSVDDSGCIYELQKAYNWCSTTNNKLSPLWRRYILKNPATNL